jgi:hypothetical protein
MANDVIDTTIPRANATSADNETSPDSRASVDRRLTPVQVARVLELAARMEDEPENTGLTLGELQDVAAEAGIPAEAIRRALAQLAREAASSESTARGPRSVTPSMVANRRGIPVRRSWDDSSGECHRPREAR